MNTTTDRTTIPQLPFEIEPLITPVYERGESTDAKFGKWIAANPHVLDLFINLASAMQQRGRKRIGAKAIVERIRWEHDLRSEGDEFRLNNLFTSRLVRRAIAARPGLAEMFELRALKDVE